VAIAMVDGVGDLVDTGGRKLEKDPATVLRPAAHDPKSPVVLVVDADSTVRESLKIYLGAEGYQVVALATAAEAHQALKMLTPALLIAEIEGEDLPGFELCAHVKATPRLKTVPVVLLTSSAYPSDYSNAHSLGAVVCMGKPYRQERLGHIVRMLAPTQQAKEQTAPPRPADATRNGRGNAKPPASTPTQGRRWSW